MPETPPLRALARKVRGYLRAPAQSARGEVAVTGDYASWAEAEAHCTGYSAPVIVERTCASLLKVKRGEAVFERDSVLFDSPEYSFPVLTGLLRVALLNGGRLSVADFGGSLGSSYFQFRHFLQGATCLEWSVIEQPAHVRCGREHFEDQALRFFDTMAECLASRRPNVLLMSGVIQCLPDPYGALKDLLAHGIRHVIVDRAAFLAADRDRLTVETVPDWIYPASYPSWFLSETKVTGAVTAAGYSLVADFAGIDRLAPPDEAAYFKGFICDLAAVSPKLT
jgi:putative methyltransferase (TIGR04325 family)